MMMVALQGWIYAVIIALALVQKRFVSVAGVHFFNPSNFALMAALLLFYTRAHLVLGQMGDALWLRVLVWGLAGAILLRVDRWMIPLAFVPGYVILEYFWLVDYDPVMTFETIYERFYSVSFMIFVVFMLTDPRTTPSKRWMQVSFGVAVALIAAGLDRWHGFRVQHLFMALFLLSPWVPWLWAERDEKKRFLFWGAVLFFVAMGAIILIENRPPYYFEMNR
jgi:Na+-translocating ferredoxin:NAD+ oxidoreductase RnfD subunit